MAGTIRINPEQMKGRATEYRAQRDTVDDVITKLDSLLESLTAEWEGDSSNAFADRYNNLRPGFVSVRDLIEDIAAALDATANDLEDMDSQIGKQWRG